MTAVPLLALSGIVKRYGEVVAVDGVDLAVGAGEVHALVGENGAGKTTLMKVLSGAIGPDDGMIRIDGHEVSFPSPADAIAAGIGMIPQDLQLVPAMSVAENIVLGAEPLRGRGRFLDRAARNAVAAGALRQLDESLELDAPVASLPVAARQLVEIARGIVRRVRVLALDEPTAALSDRETARLFALIRQLTADGVGIIYISHRLDEVLAIADRVTVLRDGKAVATESASKLDRSALVRLMVGRDVPPPEPGRSRSTGGPMLTLSGISGGAVSGIDLTLRRGEVLGIAGLVGAGRTDLTRLIFGADRTTGGRMQVEGKDAAPRTPREAIALGIGLLTEDRDGLGLIRQMNVRENITLAGLAHFCRGPFIVKAGEAAAARGLAERLRIKAPSTEAPITQLSGGNRQKVVLARWIESDSKILIFDEPTAGVDVGAREEIHALIGELASGGRGVIVVSSDLDELLGLCDRIVVMRRGRITGELAGRAATREAVMSLATA